MKDALEPVRPIPPKPPARPDDAGIWERIKLFRADMFRSQPTRLYRAWMARMATPLYDSILANDPHIVREILEGRPNEFPKAGMIGEMLRPLLGQSVFVTNGDLWKRQRRIIDPAFAAGRLRDTYPAMLAAGEDGVSRLGEGVLEMEFEAAHVAADIIFRTLFSIPISEPRARSVFDAFQAYQRTQPLLSLRALMRLPRWLPALARPRGARDAAAVRDVLTRLVADRAAEIERGDAPDDLATKIMTMADPETNERFSEEEMIDQVAIFFLAGHETSASALAWGLYCLALTPDIQDQIADEVHRQCGDRSPTFEDVAKLHLTRDVFREVLRLYPPVPMMVREAVKPERFRETDLRAGALCILSPWHLHRHERLWSDPDVFRPERWQDPETKETSRAAYLPFSKGPRVCTGAGFAMIEGVLLLALLVRAYRFEPVPGPPPVPVAHLTVRSEAGINLRLTRR